MGIDFIRLTAPKHRKAYAAQAARASGDWIAASATMPVRVGRAITDPAERLCAGDAVVLRQTPSGDVVVDRDAHTVARLPNPSAKLTKHLARNCGVAAASVHVVFADQHIVDLKVEL